MNIEEYFQEVQEYIKQNIDNNSQINSYIKDLEKDNIQAVINQDYNNNLSIEECGDKLLKQLNNKSNSPEQPAQNQLNGERGINTLENKIINFSDFKLNEDITNQSAMDIIDKIEEETTNIMYADEEELKNKLYKISDLISDLRFQCE